MAPLVSVIMPVHNGGPWLRPALDSVLAQSLAQFELLAVDDGSTDGSGEVLRACAEADQRVRVLQPPGRGLVGALNCAIAAARAPLIARLDADDVARPERLAIQSRFLDAHARIGLIGSFAEKIDEDGRVIGRLTPATGSDELVKLLAHTNPFIHSSIMMRSEIVRRLGGFRAAFEAAEDYDLWLRIAEVAEIGNLPDCLTLYRWHPANVSQRKELRQSFSLRLARRSAAGRRETGRDPADTLAGPPDWHADGAGFWADDARLYRILELSDPARPAPAADPDLTPLIAGFATLTHKERKFAQRALLNLVKHGRGVWRALRLMSLVVSLHPGRALPLAWSVLARSSAS